MMHFSHDIVTAVISLACFLFALIFFILFIMADKAAFAHTAITYEGLWQRLSLLTMYTPIFLAACKQLKLSL